MSIKKDYKPDSTWRNRQQVRYTGLLVIVLVLIGLFGSVLAYIGRYKAQPVSAAQPYVKAAPETRAKQPAETALPVVSAAKPKYDFYQVLPQQQVVISRDEVIKRAPKQDALALTEAVNKPAQPVAAKPAPSLATATQAKATSPTLTEGRGNSELPAKTAGGYFIQVGSFRSSAEAERRKAAVALLGANARIEAGVDANGSMLHRVRIGPIKDYNQVQTLIQRLQANNIPSLPVKAN